MGEHFRNLSCFGCDGGSSCSGFCLLPHCLETFSNPFLRKFLIRGCASLGSTQVMLLFAELC